jgi:hypothetical protein
MRWPDMSDVRQRGIERRERANTICKCARRRGLDANLAMVLRNFDKWERWYLGLYPTGYLMRTTGVRRIK